MVLHPFADPAADRAQVPLGEARPGAAIARLFLRRRKPVLAEAPAAELEPNTRFIFFFPARWIRTAGLFFIQLIES